MHKPYPPGNLKINTTYWPASTSSPLTVTWATRNRLQQTAGLIDYYTTDITPETSLTYSATLKRTDTSVLLTSFTGVAASPQTLTTAYIGQVLLEIWTINANGISLKVNHTFNLV